MAGFLDMSKQEAGWKSLCLILVGALVGFNAIYHLAKGEGIYFSEDYRSACNVYQATQGEIERWTERLKTDEKPATAVRELEKRLLSQTDALNCLGDKNEEIGCHLNKALLGGYFGIKLFSGNNLDAVFKIYDFLGK